VGSRPLLAKAGLTSVRGTLAALWGVVGVAAIIVASLHRLLPLGQATYSHSLTWAHWLAISTWVPIATWLEGYRGFHLSFSPMVASRARYLRDHPRPLHAVLAPLFCIGLIHATRRRVIRSTALTLGITAAVLLVRQVSQPWRGIIDLGVVGGLTFGLASLLYWSFRALTSDAFHFPPEVPEDTRSPS
jgi:hypothetical protein